jgi:hypothetical protein
MTDDDSSPLKKRRIGIDSGSLSTDRRTRPEEFIRIDVGGRVFCVSKSTLADSASYFESLLSDRWAAKEDDSDVFIDQDPDAFEILLTSMRCGIVHLPKGDLYLSKKALILAEYLGLHGFLTTVKAITMKNIARRSEYLSDESSESVQFDSRFGSLRLAVEKGILPLCFSPPGDDLIIRVSDRVFHASKAVLIERSGYFARYLTTNPEDYWKEEYISSENPDVMEVALQMLSSPNSAFTTMTEKFHSVSGQNVKFRHFYIQAILTWLDKLQLPVDFRDNCVQTITHTFNA